MQGIPVGTDEQFTVPPPSCYYFGSKQKHTTIQKLELDNYKDPLFQDFRGRLLDFLTIQLRLDGVLTTAQSVQYLDFNEKACI